MSCGHIQRLTVFLCNMLPRVFRFEIRNSVENIKPYKTFVLYLPLLLFSPTFPLSPLLSSAAFLFYLFFNTRAELSCGPLSLLYSGYRVSFAGLKRRERDINHPPPSRAEVKERVGLHIYSPLCLQYRLQGDLYL
jgi:hypothetical protein